MRHAESNAPSHFIPGGWIELHGSFSCIAGNPICVFAAPAATSNTCDDLQHICLLVCTLCALARKTLLCSPHSHPRPLHHVTLCRWRLWDTAVNLHGAWLHTSSRAGRCTAALLDWKYGTLPAYIHARFRGAVWELQTSSLQRMHSAACMRVCPTQDAQCMIHGVRSCDAQDARCACLAMH